MNRYLTSIQDAEETDSIIRIPVDEPVEVYRVPDIGHKVVAEKSGEITELGPIGDARVSRKKGDRAPVEVRPTDNGIKVLNRNSTNRVKIEEGYKEIDLLEGDARDVSDGCKITLGKNVTLRANVSDVGQAAIPESNQERDGKEEYLTRKLHATGESVTAGTTTDSVDENTPSKVFAKVIDLVEMSVETNQIHECRKHIKDLHDLLIETPIEHPEYKSIKQKIETDYENIERWDQNDGKDEIGDKREKEIKFHLHNVERLYVED